MTCKYHIAVLYWDDNGKVRTRASGCVAERIGRPSETGIVATVHSSSVSLISYLNPAPIIDFCFSNAQIRESSKWFGADPEWQASGIKFDFYSCVGMLYFLGAELIPNS